MNPPPLSWDPAEFTFAGGTKTANTLVCRRCGALVYGHPEAQNAHLDEHAARARHGAEIAKLVDLVARAGGDRAFFALVVAHFALGAGFVLHLFRLGRLGLPW